MDSWNLVLNGPGARAFDLIDGQRTVRMVAQMVFEEYGAASLSEVEADVAEMIYDLSTRGALEEVLT
jgi:outer membrane receptor for monomeric catechols